MWGYFIDSEEVFVKRKFVIKMWITQSVDG